MAHQTQTTTFSPQFPSAAAGSMPEQHSSARGDLDEPLSSLPDSRLEQPEEAQGHASRREGSADPLGWQTLAGSVPAAIAQCPPGDLQHPLRSTRLRQRHHCQNNNINESWLISVFV